MRKMDVFNDVKDLPKDKKEATKVYKCEIINDEFYKGKISYMVEYDGMCHNNYGAVNAEYSAANFKVLDTVTLKEAIDIAFRNKLEDSTEDEVKIREVLLTYYSEIYKNLRRLLNGIETSIPEDLSSGSLLYGLHMFEDFNKLENKPNITAYFTRGLVLYKYAIDNLFDNFVAYKDKSRKNEFLEPFKELFDRFKPSTITLAQLSDYKVLTSFENYNGLKDCYFNLAVDILTGKKYIGTVKYSSNCDSEGNGYSSTYLDVINERLYITNSMLVVVGFVDIKYIIDEIKEGNSVKEYISFVNEYLCNVANDISYCNSISATAYNDLEYLSVDEVVNELEDDDEVDSVLKDRYFRLVALARFMLSCSNTSKDARTFYFETLSSIVADKLDNKEILAQAKEKLGERGYKILTRSLNRLKIFL